ncbi:MAG: hypothetical protein S4CHLAM81_13830 [Chlamydiales bacterium]|nr:hypothetical protein [Chlamydiales bacterium]MCH9636155.1 hypothetical protein [Chlamydiales bacterium]
MDLIKFLHVASVFFWISCLLVLSRQLAYQKEAPSQRSYFQVELPAMCLTILTGLLLIFLKGVDWKAPWLHMKLTFVGILVMADLLFLGRLIQKKGGVGSKVLHWVVVLSLLAVLAAIYVMKPKFM